MSAAPRHPTARSHHDDPSLTGVGDLLRSQRVAVLATAMDNRPYTSIVAFAELPDLSRILVVTPRATRKYRNACQNPHIALLIDNRGNADGDFHQAAAVTIIGHVLNPGTADKPAGDRAVFVARHPYLATFFDAPSTALLDIRVTRYIWVDHFQRVIEIEPP